MHQIWDTQNQPMSINVTIECKGKKSFRVWCEDYGKKNSKYADRVIEVEGKRTIYLSLPVTTRQMFLGCLNSQYPQDTDFTVTFMEAPLRKYDIYMDDDTKEFVDLCIFFSQVCGFRKPDIKGTMYSTKNGHFNIKYFPVIRDYATGNPMTTPARIGHDSGVIEISAYKYVPYTIPMRIMILLHEFSHKYKNPKIGLEIENEIGADINALYIYLGMGFSKIDAICVYANVFLKAQTPENRERLRKILDYIQRFENQEFAQAA